MKIRCKVPCLAALLFASADYCVPVLATGKSFFPDEEIPRFNVPKAAEPPTIDGTLDLDDLEYG